MLFEDNLMYESFLFGISNFTTCISLYSLRRSSVLSVLVWSHLYNSGVDSAPNTVLHFDVEFWDDVGFEGSVFFEIFFGWGIDDISDGESFDGFVFGAESAAVDADDGFDVASVVFVPAVVSTFDGHAVANYIKIYLLI